MKPHALRKLAASALVVTLLSGTLSGCDEIFRPVEEETYNDHTNPYIHWQETVPPTSPTEVTAPQEEGELGYITAKQVNLREGPGTHFDSLGSLTMGTQVRILEKRAEDGVLWGLTEDGWVSMKYVSLDTGTPALVGSITAKTLNVRSGPGTNYDVVGTVKKGDQVIVYEQESSGSKTWGKIDSGWVSMEYVNITGATSGGTQEPELPENVTNTAIVGSWLCMEEQNYFDGLPLTASVWTFLKNGTCTLSTSSYTYQGERGWQTTGNPTQKTGTYAFDGRTLTVDGEDLSVAITGDVMEVYSHRTYSLMLRGYNVGDLIRELIKRDRGVSDESICGAWAGARKQDAGESYIGTKWYFGKDGSFSCAKAEYRYDATQGWYAATEVLTYSGVYCYDGTRLTLCYETVTGGTSLETTSYLICEVLTDIAISGSSMMMPDTGTYLKKDGNVADVIAAANG